MQNGPAFKWQFAINNINVVRTLAAGAHRIAQSAIIICNLAQPKIPLSWSIYFHSKSRNQIRRRIAGRVVFSCAFKCRFARRKKNIFRMTPITSFIFLRPSDKYRAQAHTRKKQRRIHSVKIRLAWKFARKSFMCKN